MTEYNVKFMFADAVTIELTFPNGVGVRDAKTKVIASWPADKEAITGPDDLKMIHSGKVLDNAKTFEDYKVPKGSQVVMHLQPRPAPPPVEAAGVSRPAKTQGEATRCCTIL
uniref:Ubiquitin-like domain-containing protein n=1 Tax=Hemiselmis andersenii TaxID=464988 RepID=A0A6T8JAD6_HEMAN|mmetsp:Transcript_24239/g.56234  ORF Transcript_24239/g.56234 Transcript_24239/m.56234 type:complete len:112 (+) Transcript_24239:239-574(+)|eukprot:CAMPEP_0169434674 /NCGR_PEP_ID=MMETSP1042-20121227/4660_1 /TAXON_ID=464988 /ORGANISM="Hemiselmis andersenii, Strain CCMP1180" /LENGTH=111 /DNA_ID=CAMNT_0009545275 /DNA_START=230 /DNA_END=565 /DNA_ORIENTATION=+